MSATARAPLVRAGPGVSAWTALLERDPAVGCKGCQLQESSGLRCR